MTTNPSLPESTPDDGTPLRRGVFKGGLASLFVLAFARQASAAVIMPADAGSPRPAKEKDAPALPARRNAGEMLDRVAITDLIMRERWAREAHDAEMAAACFHPDARVEVSWFKGSAAEYVERGSAWPSADAVSVDTTSPPVIWIKGDRAIADTACTVHAFAKLDGVEVRMASHTRLLWRARMRDGQWLVAGLRAIHLRDSLEPSVPGQALKLDEKKLAQYRPAYRYLAYLLEAGGRPLPGDLPGADRPETVVALRAAERQWLEQA